VITDRKLFSVFRTKKLPVKSPRHRISRQSSDGFNDFAEEQSGPVRSVERAPLDLRVESVIRPEHQARNRVHRDGERFIQLGRNHLKDKRIRQSFEIYSLLYNKKPFHKLLCVH
jgi:hypothetical protein